MAKARWDVSTLARQLAVGVSLCVTESPQIDGGPYSKPATGEIFKIEFSGGSTIGASIEEASDAEIVIRVGDVRWRLTPWRRGEPDPHIRTPDMHSTYWVVRSKT
jgi:hypothetical protein